MQVDSNPQSGLTRPAGDMRKLLAVRLLMPRTAYEALLAVQVGFEMVDTLASSDTRITVMGRKAEQEEAQH